MTRCSECNARLAHDQRYCVECGHRRGPLPDFAAAMVAALRDPDRLEQAAVPAPAPQWRQAPTWVPTPRAAALAIMGMLAFGAEIGAVVGATGGAAIAAAPLIVVDHHSSPATSAAGVGSLGAGSLGGGGSGSTRVISETITVGGAGSSGGSSAPASSSGSGTPASSTTTSSSTSTAPSNPYGLPAIKHVFVIMLADQGYGETFGSADPYLSHTLSKQGKLLEWYYSVAGGELANQIALVSGQGPTEQTDDDCPTFQDISPGKTGKAGQVLGDGCVYPRSTKTLGDQLTADHLTWKAYIQGMVTGTPGQTQPCRHPAVGAADPNQAPQVGDTYVTWRNPFVYFDSAIDTKACQDDDVDLSQLSTDLTNESTTPSLSYIVPNACDDGSDQPCTPGATSGIAAADSFLRSVVPEIEQSDAYQEGGLIAITFDQAPQTGEGADQSACCSTPKYPNLPAGFTPAPPPSPSASTSTSTTSAAAFAVASSTPAPASSTSTPTTADTASTPTTSTSTTTTTTTTTTTSTAATSTILTTVTSTPAPPAATLSPSTSQSTTSPTTTSSTTTAPNLGSSQGGTSSTGGGGRVGLLLISPWVKPGTQDLVDYYNHYSLLASIEDIFDLKHLGYAGQSGLPVLDSGTFDGKGPSGG